MKKRPFVSPLQGRRLWIPRMSTEGSECVAAAFRALGIDAQVTPPSDEETLPLAARWTTGEECLPLRVVLGNVLRIVREEGFDPSKVAFFLPTSAGPCRFGQYAPFVRKILREIGAEEALVFSPTSSDSYAEIAHRQTHFMRTVWRAVVVSDLVRKLQLMVRPYASHPAEADQVLREGLEALTTVLSDPAPPLKTQMRRLQGVLEGIRDTFLALSLKEPLRSRPLVGIVGEIFLRLDPFSNQDVVRQIEAHGGECWMADVGEWVWYTLLERERKLKETGKRFGLDMTRLWLRSWIQHEDERRLMSPLKKIFQYRPEMPVRRLLRRSAPYLPQEKAYGEMTLNAGKTIAFYEAGCDGVIDISPFTCMNGIVTEVFYPIISRDHDQMPIRIFYFDGAVVDLARDLEIFMELVRAYRRRRLFSHS